jgi:hypothetical protein
MRQGGLRAAYWQPAEGHDRVPPARRPNDGQPACRACEEPARPLEQARPRMARVARSQTASSARVTWRGAWRIDIGRARPRLVTTARARYSRRSKIKFIDDIGEWPRLRTVGELLLGGTSQPGQVGVLRSLRSLSDLDRNDCADPLTALGEIGDPAGVSRLGNNVGEMLARCGDRHLLGHGGHRLSVRVVRTERNSWRVNPGHGMPPRFVLRKTSVDGHRSRWQAALHRALLLTPSG